MTKQQSAATITDCETDTSINTDHYPMLAKLSVKLRRINKDEKEIYRYSDKTIWKDKDQMNKTIAEILSNRNNHIPGRQARKAREYLRERDMIGQCEPIPTETLERAFAEAQVWEIQTANENCREYTIRRTLTQYEQEDTHSARNTDQQYNPINQDEWKNINRIIVESQPKRNPSARKDNLSDETRKLIKEKALINPITEHRRWKRIRKKIKKQREEDKVEWINDLVNSSKNSKELFAGIDEICRKFQPKRYIRKDIRGKM